MNDETTERLIARAADGDTSDAEWLELTRRANAAPDLWRYVAETQRDQIALIAAVGDAAEAADRVEAPVTRATRRPIRVTAWTGWLVAAGIALAWVIGLTRPDTAVLPGPGGGGEGMVRIDSADDALREYLDRGRSEQSVIRELPTRVLLESRPMEGSDGYELYYLRQILERAVVPEMYELRGQDEGGRPTLVRYEQPVGQPM